MLTPSLAQRTHWIFDMDGTLTQPAHDFVFARRTLKIPPHGDILSEIGRRSIPEQEAAHRWLNAWEEDIARRAQPQQDAVELLTWLHDQGCVYGVVTRNTKPNALLTLEAAGLSKWFPPEVILGREDAPPKPDPAALNRLLKQWNAAPHQAVMVGDYIHDSRAGRAAGVATLLVLRHQETGWQHEADFVVDHLFPLPDDPDVS